MNPGQGSDLPTFGPVVGTWDGLAELSWTSAVILPQENIPTISSVSRRKGG